ncbi:hypothetical protein FPQ18DRAFT_396964 [Pyronema domesticum]|nr:hypothetical protein FPQ18DRAFT_396964 [Pyronema domesticum]
MSKTNHDKFASDYDLQFNFEQECEGTLCSQPEEKASDIFNFDLPIQADEQTPNPTNLDLPLDEYYDDSEYDPSYGYYEQEEEEEQGIPHFECEEVMHSWMLKNAEDSHRTALFKDVGNQYPVWMK